MAAVDLIFGLYQTFYLVMFWGWWAVLLVFAFVMKFLWKAWKVEAIIFEKRLRIKRDISM